MSFITNTDLLTAIYQEQLDAITREDDAIPQFGIDAAVEEMKGYLSPKYDTDKIFAKEGTGRNNLLVTFCRDIAVYHIINLSNPGVDYKSKEARYNRAVEWLKHVQSGKVNPPDLDLNTEEEDNEILMSSNTKRTNHY
jgi:phage gp36-like protein